MRNAGLDEAQAGIKIAGRNINNLRYADDTTLMAESLLMKVKEEHEKAGLKLSIQKTNIMASGPITSRQIDGGTMDWSKIGKGVRQACILLPCLFGPTTSWQIDGETMERMRDFIFLGLKITLDDDCGPEIKRRLLLGRKAMTNLDSILKNRGVTLPTKVHIGKAMVFHVQI